MHHKKKYIILPVSTSLSFALSSPKAILQQLLNMCFGNRRNRAERVGGFFEANRETPEREDIQDGSTGYLLPAHEWVVSIAKQQDPRTFVDIGCGDGNASKYAKTLKIKYIGIDLVAPEVATDNEQYVSADISKELVIPMAPDTVCFFLCSNVMCYLDNLDGLLDFLSSHGAVGSYLAVVEPSGRFFWETRFHGVSVRLRTAKCITETIGSRGWELQNQTGMYMTAIFGRPYLKTTSILVFKKQ